MTTKIKTINFETGILTFDVLDDLPDEDGNDVILAPNRFAEFDPADVKDTHTVAQIRTYAQNAAEDQLAQFAANQRAKYERVQARAEDIRQKALKYGIDPSIES